MEKTKKTISPQQQLFLDFLCDEAKGDFRTALRMAGYSDSTKVADVIRLLREEIVEATMSSLAHKAPRAAYKLGDLLENPNAPAAGNVLKAAKEILDRVGVVTVKDDMNLKIPQSGLFIMPAKGSSKVQEDESEQNS